MRTHSGARRQSADARRRSRAFLAISGRPELPLIVVSTLRLSKEAHLARREPWRGVPDRCAHRLSRPSLIDVNYSCRRATAISAGAREVVVMGDGVELYRDRAAVATSSAREVTSDAPTRTANATSRSPSAGPAREPHPYASFDTARGIGSIAGEAPRMSVDFAIEPGSKTLRAPSQVYPFCDGQRSPQRVVFVG